MSQEQWEITWRDYYETLGLPPVCTDKEIHDAYIYKLYVFHPDRFHGAPEKVCKQAEDDLKKINEAFEVLGDSTKRHRYDEAWKSRILATSSTRNKAQPDQETQKSPAADDAAGKRTNSHTASDRKPPKKVIIIEPKQAMFPDVPVGEKRIGKFAVRASGAAWKKIKFVASSPWITLLSHNPIARMDKHTGLEITYVINTSDLKPATTYTGDIQIFADELTPFDFSVTCGIHAESTAGNAPTIESRRGEQNTPGQSQPTLNASSKAQSRRRRVLLSCAISLILFVFVVTIYFYIEHAFNGLSFPSYGNQTRENSTATKMATITSLLAYADQNQAKEMTNKWEKIKFHSNWHVKPDIPNVYIPVPGSTGFTKYDVKDFSVTAVFSNNSEENWSYGYGFRETKDRHFRLIVNGYGYWQLDYVEYIPIGNRRLYSLFTTLQTGRHFNQSRAGGRLEQVLQLTTKGNLAVFKVNNVVVDTLDLASINEAGALWLGSGFYDGDSTLFAENSGYKFISLD